MYTVQRTEHGEKRYISTEDHLSVGLHRGWLTSSWRTGSERPLAGGEILGPLGLQKNLPLLKTSFNFYLVISMESFLKSDFKF